MAYHCIIRRIHGTLPLLILRKRDVPIFKTENKLVNIINWLSLSFIFERSVVLCFQSFSISTDQDEVGKNEVQRFNPKKNIFVENLALEISSRELSNFDQFFPTNRKFWTLLEGAPRWKQLSFRPFSMTTPLSSC